MTEPTFDFDNGGLGQDLGVPVVVIPKKTLPPRWPTLKQVPIVIDTGLRPVLGEGIDWVDIGIFQPHPNQPRNQMTVLISEAATPSAATLFEDVDPNSPKRYYVPQYRLAEQTLDGHSTFQVSLRQIDATNSRLTVQLTAVPRDGGTDVLPTTVSAYLQYVSGAAGEMVDLTVAVDGGTYTATREISSNNERDELYRALTDNQGRTHLFVRHVCRVALPVEGGLYHPADVVLDAEVDRVPFVFSPELQAYIFEGITNVGAQSPDTIDRTIEWQGRTHHYLQSASRPSEFAYLPDEFKIIRRDAAVRGPSITVQFRSDDGSLEHMTADVEYAAAPIVDAGRLAAAATVLQGFVPGPAGGTAPAPKLHALVVADTNQLDLQVTLPPATPGAPAVMDRPGVVTSLTDTFRDRITGISLPAFQEVFDALFGASDVLFSGQVKVAGGDGRPELIVPFTARLDDLVGEVFEFADQQPQPGGMSINLINRAESPVVLQALPVHLLIDGNPVNATASQLTVNGKAATFPITVPAAATLAVRAVAGHVPPAIRRELHRGNTGDDVKAMQAALHAAGAAITADGDFGPLTEAAVRAFQKEAGLPVTGVGDKATLALLKVTDTGQPVIKAIMIDTSGEHVTPVKDAVWTAIVDPNVPAVYTRTIQVITFDSAFTPTTDVQLIVLDFTDGGSVTLRPGQLEGSAAVHVPLADVVLRRGTDGTYTYTQVTVRASGQVRRTKTDQLEVLVPQADS
jgi:peptidoglycan hydrolase-like protein with peptidoglycan-binding domain